MLNREARKNRRRPQQDPAAIENGGAAGTRARKTNEQQGKAMNSKEKHEKTWKNNKKQGKAMKNIDK